jgi:DNA-directed RNA polymerase specialized sigma subunit
MASNGHEIACLYKNRIKKLLIKYEAKENPNMKINEIAAELDVFKSKVNENMNKLIEHFNSNFKSLVASDKELWEDLNSLKDKCELKNEVLPEILNKYNKAIDALRQIFQCSSFDLIKSPQAIAGNTLISLGESIND